MRLLLSLCLIGLLAGCGTQRNIAWCQSQGLAPNTRAWNACMQDFAAREAVFQRDRADCSLQADAYYPQTLYDRGHYESYRVIGYSGFPHRERFFVPGDYRHNAELDALRNRIIYPCMQRKGWVDPRGWEYGRR